VLYKKDILKDDINWKSVHSVLEVPTNCKSQVPYAMLRCKALNIFSAQHPCRYVITVWMTHAHFGATLFDHSGEIKACWSYMSQDTYVRLIAGLVYGSEAGIQSVSGEGPAWGCMEIKDEQQMVLYHQGCLFQ